MAPRIGFSMNALRRMHVGACDSDVRLVWKDGDRFNIGIIQPREHREDWDTYFIQKIRVSCARELRLLGLQLIKHADNLEETSDEFETVLE